MGSEMCIRDRVRSARLRSHVARGDWDVAMSDDWQGPGWWIGGDGKWHPPRNPPIRKRENLHENAGENSVSEVVSLRDLSQSARPVSEADFAHESHQGPDHRAMTDTPHTDGPSVDGPSVDDVASERSLGAHERLDAVTAQEEVTAADFAPTYAEPVLENGLVGDLSLIHI